jgi:acetyl-CoA carboxylase biotin carboxyl carrier protein
MSGGILFDPATIRALAEILRDTELTEIELVDKESRIRLARELPAPVLAPAAALPPMGWAPPPAALTGAAPAAPAAAAPPVADEDHPGLVTSPMVGVAYLSPEPGQPAYVTPGARVEQGQTLLLIEAMKTFNQIKAPRAGTVTRILIESGAPVEFGAPLLIVE